MGTPLRGRLLSRLSPRLTRSSEESYADHKVPAFIAQKLQILRRPDHVVDRRRIGLPGGIIDAAAQRKTVSVERYHSLQRDIEIEVKGIAVRIHRADDSTALIANRKEIPAA